MFSAEKTREGETTTRAEMGWKFDYELTATTSSVHFLIHSYIHILSRTSYSDTDRIGKV